jgi:hypothetical protein
MARSKDGSKNKGAGKALGVVGVSLSLAGAACAESSPADASTARTTSNMRTMDMHEVEIFDTTLGTFRVFDREETKTAKPEAVTWWRCRCGGCGGCRRCWRCGCGG